MKIKYKDWRDNLPALPDVSSIEYYIETLPDGPSVQHRLPPILEVHPYKNSDPAFFVDGEGCWAVVYHLKGGPYKRRMSF